MEVDLEGDRRKGDKIVDVRTRDSTGVENTLLFLCSSFLHKVETGL